MRRYFYIVMFAAPALAGSGLVYAQTATPAAPPVQTLPEENVVGSTPLLGSGVPRDQVPAATQVLTPQDVSRTGVPSLTDALNAAVPSVHLSDSSGNPWQPDILFRGFTASPVEGETQGLAVYVNGQRFNSAFGDTVNWDLIPANAIAQVNVEGGNPAFGLNALGGSVNVKLKDGFSYHGGDLTVYGGMYGRAAALFQYGAESDNTSAYVAANVIHDRSWRATGASDVRQIYTDLGWRGRDAEVHASITAADNQLGNPGATPVDLLSVDRAAASTSPNTVTNKYVNLNLSGTYDVTDSTSVQAVAYVSNFHQYLLNGVTEDASPCDPTMSPYSSTTLCEGDAMTAITQPNGALVPADLGSGSSYSGLALQSINTTAYGASAQVSNQSAVFGLHNRIVAGLSVDAGETDYGTKTLIGGISPARTFIGPGYVMDQADQSSIPVMLHTYNQYYGAFFNDRLEVTNRLALSLSGRFNLVDTSIHDTDGVLLDQQQLNASHQYSRFNPGIGLTYQVARPVQAYLNYSEANRAPTPNESECSNAAIPCLLPNAFLSDPPLKQVVARTFEAGVRGRLPDVAGGRLTWDADAFHTENTDDLVFKYDANANAGGYYSNIGRTLRQGFEATITWRGQGVRATLGYTYTDATYQSAFPLSSPNNPGTAANNGIENVVAGDRLPGVPAHKLTLVADYDVTDRLTVGGSLIASSSQFLYLDDANLTKQLGGFVVANVNATYRVADHIQIFGLVNNVTDQRYATYGTFAPVSLISPNFSNTRVYSPAAPIAAYGGVRVTF